MVSKSAKTVSTTLAVPANSFGYFMFDGGNTRMLHIENKGAKQGPAEFHNEVHTGAQFAIASYAKSAGVPLPAQQEITIETPHVA